MRRRRRRLVDGHGFVKRKVAKLAQTNPTLPPKKNSIYIWMSLSLFPLEFGG
jgi:hypothetical protein